VAGTGGSAQSLRDVGDADGGLKIGAIKSRGLGREDQVRPLGGGQSNVALEVARVGGIILVGAELDGIDEDAHHHFSGFLPGAPDEARMSFVQIAHGRDQGDGLAGQAPAFGHCGHPGRTGDDRYFTHFHLYSRNQ